MARTSISNLRNVRFNMYILEFIHAKHTYGLSEGRQAIAYAHITNLITYPVDL